MRVGWEHHGPASLKSWMKSRTELAEKDWEKHIMNRKMTAGPKHSKAVLKHHVGSRFLLPFWPGPESNNATAVPTPACTHSGRELTGELTSVRAKDVLKPSCQHTQAPQPAACLVAALPAIDVLERKLLIQERARLDYPRQGHHRSPIMLEPCQKALFWITPRALIAKATFAGISFCHE